MIFKETKLAGVYVVELVEIEDSRGFFARSWCEQEFEQQGLKSRMVQGSISYNKKKGTLRGMHYQKPPSMEAKLIRCTLGAIFDVIIDLRPNSATLLKHFSITLSAENRRSLYVPPGFAHGFQTLRDDTEVNYLMSDFYQSEFSRGVRWNDPVFGIEWPDDERTIIERDNSYPDFDQHVLEELQTRDFLDK